MNNEVKNIDKIISILKKETKKFRQPVVSKIKEKDDDPFEILISCILSLRTKDSVTEKASERLFALADTPEKMLKLSDETIYKAILPVNYYKNKTKTIKGICKKLIEEYNGKVPDSLEELLKFKGVGRKTANIVITQAFGKYGIPVDIHVHRISNRLGIVRTKTPEETEFELMKVLPKKYWIAYNDLLVTWGQNICAPTSPKCSMCSISKYCPKIGVTKSR